MMMIRRKSAHGFWFESIDRFSAMNVGPNDTANKM
jgi:hypothetical protein